MRQSEPMPCQKTRWFSACFELFEARPVQMDYDENDPSSEN